MIKNIFIYLLCLIIEYGLIAWFVYNLGSDKYFIISITVVSILLIITIISFIKTVL